MAISDKKKAQTLINLCADAAEKARAAVAQMGAVRDLYVAASVDPTGTPLEGNVTAVSNAITALKAETDKALWSTLIAAKVPSHRNKALD